VRQLGLLAFRAREERVVDDDGQEIGVGDVAVVVRVLFAAHRARDTRVGIPEPRLLHDRAALLDLDHLASRLVHDGVAEEAR